MTDRYPWFKFFPADWQGDELLAVCSYAARGFLVELMCLMDRATPRGYVLLNGQPPTEAQLGRLTRGDAAEAVALRGELLASGVLSQTAEGVLYSRRMVRDTARVSKAREDGLRGGNPVLTGGRRAGKGSALAAVDGAKAWKFSNLYISPKMHACISAKVGNAAKIVDWDKLYERAACDYLEHGQPANALDDLQARARQAGDRARSAAAAAREVERTRARSAPPADVPSDEERLRLLEEMRRNRPLGIRAR